MTTPLNRIQILGPTWFNGENGTSSVAGRGLVSGVRFDDIVFASRGTASAFQLRTFEFAAAGTTRQQIFIRFYVRPVALATNGFETRLYSLAGTVEGTAAFVINMDATGKIKAYSVGNGTPVQIGVSSVVTVVGGVYRVEAGVSFNTQTYPGNDSTATCYVEGTSLGAGAGTTLYGIGLNAQQCNAHFFGTKDEAGDASFDMWYVAIDGAVLPGAGHVATLRPNGPGTYSAWAGLWQSVAEDRADVNTALALTSSTPGAKHSVTVQAFSELFIRRTSTIKAVAVVAKFDGVATGQVLLRKNGVEYLSTSYTSGGIGTIGWVFNTSTIGTVKVTDTLEIGVVHDGTTDTFNLLALSLVVEFEPAINPIDHRVHVAVGGYTGNGTAQDVVVGNWAPDLLIVAPNASTGIPCLKFRNTLYGVVKVGDPTPRADLIPKVTAHGFTVGSALAVINQDGVAYTYLAIQDQGGVLCDHGAFTPKQGNPDDVNQALTNGAFLPEMLWAYRQSSSSTPQFHMRHTSQVGDLSTSIGTDAASAADAIQAMSAGTFQVGQVLTQNNPYNLAWLAWRTTNFNVSRLCQIDSYLGDGTSGRVVTLSHLAHNLAWVLVIPSNTEKRHFKHTGHAAGSSQEWVSGTVRAGSFAYITAMSGKTFTVNGSGLGNTSGATYYVIGFSAGVDSDEPIVDDADIGLTWVELTDKANNLRVYSKVALPDRLVYFGGYKEPRVTTWGTIKRELSDDFGQYASSDFQFELDDTDRSIRNLLAANSTRYFRNRPVVARMISDPGRRLEQNPRTVVRGTINDYTPKAGLLFSFTVQDQLAAQFSKQTSPLPQRVVTLDDFPNCPSGNTSDTTTGKTFTTTSVPAPTGYVQLSDQAAAKNLLGQISNGVYGPSETRGWYGYTGTGSAIAIGTWPLPMTPGDVYFATQDVATALEAAGGGASTFSSVGLPVPIIYGAITDLNITAGRDTGLGQCPVIYVGDYTVAGKIYHKFLVCGHAVLSIDGLYTDNGATGVGTSPASQVGDLSVAAGTGGDWLVPGYDAWTDAFGDPTPYEDINGNRYTTLYGLVGNHVADVAAGFYPPLIQGSVPLAVSVQGIEDEGDGTGALITDLLLQYRHCLQNWVFDSYTSGAWLDTPFFDDDPDVAVMDDDSFDTASTLAQARVPGGYRGDFIIGWTAQGGGAGPGGGFVQLKELLTRFNQSADVNCAFNRRAQFFVSMLDDTASAAATATNFSDLEDIFTGSFDIQDDLSHQYNDVPFSHTEDFFGRETGGWRSVQSGYLDVANQASIDGNDATLVAPPILMYMVRGQNKATDYSGYAQGTLTALDVARRFLTRHKDAPRYVTFKVGLPGVNVELGDLITVTHFEGVELGGWVNRPMRVVQHEVDPNDYSVALKCYDLQELLDTALILGDETALASTWTAATPANQAYGYLADETTGEFSDSAPGKALR